MAIQGRVGAGAAGGALLLPLQLFWPHSQACMRTFEKHLQARLWQDGQIEQIYCYDTLSGGISDMAVQGMVKPCRNGILAG